MEDKLKPNVGEVVRQMGKDIKLYQFTGGWLIGCSSPMLTPTYLRFYTERKSAEVKNPLQEELEYLSEKGTLSDKIAFGIGYAAGYSAIAFSMLMLDVSFNSNKPLWVVWGSTNALSGLYEWYRSAKNRAAAKHNEDSDLETKRYL